MLSCRHPECPEEAKVGDWCFRHYHLDYQARRQKTQSPPPAPRAKKRRLSTPAPAKCSVCGIEREKAGRFLPVVGKCYRCYQRDYQARWRQTRKATGSKIILDLTKEPGLAERLRRSAARHNRRPADEVIVILDEVLCE